MSKSLSNVPVSQIIKNQSSFEDEPKKKSREDWRKAKELEEARKAGTAPAAVDEEGRDINPHIPQYISQAPWYYGAEGPTLKHQRFEETKISTLSNSAEEFKRGLKSGPIAKRWRKGACENCGATTHKRKECMERPRKIGAKFTNEQIAPDEYLQSNNDLDYDSKRDRWAGYDVSEHQTIVDEFQKIEEAKKQMRAEKLKSGNDEDEIDSEDDEDKYADGVDMPGTKVDSKQRITVRNLRIREDTAKYLRNLDIQSAYYDPKSRAMRGNPYAGTEREVDYEGDNIVRISGDTEQHQKAQLFAWEAQKRQVDVQLLAEPTKLEALKQMYDKNKEELEVKVKDDIIEKYGGKEHLGIPRKVQVLAQTEAYREYSRSGQIVKGDEKPVIRSRYEEDVHPNNHSSVWGSFWRDGQWGYECCHSFVKNSYCCGEAGRQALEASENMTVPETSKKGEAETHSEKTEKKKSKPHKSKKDKLKKALEKEEEHLRDVERLMGIDERKRPYNSMNSVQEPTEEEIEAYKIKRVHKDDPMTNFM